MGNLCSLSISTEDTVSCCWNCAARQANYTCKLQQNLKALSMELDKLKARRDDVNRRVVFAQQQQNLRCLEEVQLWLNRARNRIAEVEELIQTGPQEIEKLCLVGCFSLTCKYSSYTFGREVATKLEEIVPLMEEGVFDQVADQNDPEATVDVRPAEPTIGLKSTLIKVCSLLEQIEVGMIGLYGLGGVGKTTLLTQINNKLSSLSSHYDAIIWVVVSKDHTTENVQSKIAEKLHPLMFSQRLRRNCIY